MIHRTWVFLILAGLVIGSIAQAEDVSEAEKAAYLKIRRVSSNMQLHRDGTVRFARFSKFIVKDEMLAPLQEFKNIEYLAIVCPSVTDKGLANIKDLTKLDTLLLSDSGITDQGLVNLASLEKLEQLYLDRTNISDQGLTAIGKRTTLKTLSLANTKVTDQGLAQLKTLTQLETLILRETQLTDAAWNAFTTLPKLKFLDLSGCKLTGQGIGQLKHIKTLEHIALNNTPLNEKHFTELGQLSQLNQLEFYNTPISRDGIQNLKGSLPKLAVFHSHPFPSTTKVAESTKQHQQQIPLKPIAPGIQKQLATQMLSPDFQRHVVPLLGKLGCNGRACHGSFQGQGGFRLSMFGYDFDSDLKNLKERIDLKTPSESLILNKPSSEEEHGGGLRLPKGGWEQSLLHHWIKEGAQGIPKEAPTFIRLEVTPKEIVFNSKEETTSLNVIAIWSDGTREDVTSLTRFQTNDETIAEITPDGKITAKGKGDTHIISFYDNGIHATPVLLPITDQVGKRYPKVASPTRIDELVNTKLKKLGVVPSDLCTDAEFLRRVKLDLIGTLPTPGEVEAFLKSPAPDKRQKKIEELLNHPAYITWWTTRLCDLTGSNAGYLGSTEMASVTAEQWRAWIEHRVKENMGWDKIVEGIVLAKSREPGEPYQHFSAIQSTYTRRVKPESFAADQKYLPHYWYRSNISQPMDKTLAFGFTFLGVRLQCAQCHKHPYDQWSKQEFEQFTEFFTRVKAGRAPDAEAHHRTLMHSLGVPQKLNTAALRRQSYLRIAAEGLPIPWNEIYISTSNRKTHPAKLLGGESLNLNDYEDPREPLMEWLLTEPNHYLAKAFVNRMWANYFHQGIIHPTDDLNLANPPSNGPLLNYLVNGFIEHDYDMKWLHREIVSSRTYQLSWKPNPTNLTDERNYSHAIPRRLPAEVAIDAITQATANTPLLGRTQNLVATRKIGQHPRSYQTRAIDFSLLIFGKPLRTTNCDCERQSEPTLLQSLYLRNDQELFDNLSRTDGWISEIQHSKKSLTEEELIRNAYLRALSRPPTKKEIANCQEYLSTSKDLSTGVHDILWALLNTQEFITNH